jgi:hypothetical protein
MSNPLNPFAVGDPDFYPVYDGDECIHEHFGRGKCRGAVTPCATPTGVVPMCERHYDLLG